MTHADRQRADSFGAAAAQYDRVRPRYPTALIDDLVAREPRHILDVGCGTGIAGEALAARGYDVLGVEPDPRMADTARAKGLAVEVSRFETWDPAGRTFDLVIAGQAWHWVQPAEGLDAAARCLEPDGWLSLFWNIGAPDPEAHRDIEAVYRRVAPALEKEAVALGRIDRSAWADHAGALTAHTAFSNASTRTYDWPHTYTSQEWVDLLRTHSDHAVLPDETRTALLDGIRDVIDQQGGSLHVAYTTILIQAARTDSE